MNRSGTIRTYLILSHQTDKNVNVYLKVQCKTLWIKVFAKYVNVNV